MATRSRNARLKARTKRTNSLLKRALRDAAFNSNKHFSTILLLLAQQGGEMLISTDTIRTTIPTVQRASYAVENTPDGARVYVVVADDVPTVDAAELPSESLQEMKERMQAAHNEPVDPTVAAEDPA